MEDTKRPIFGAEAERIGTRLDEATDEFLKDGAGADAGADAGVEPARGGVATGVAWRWRRRNSKQQTW